MQSVQNAQGQNKFMRAKKGGLCAIRISTSLHMGYPRIGTHRFSPVPVACQQPPWGPQGYHPLDCHRGEHKALVLPRRRRPYQGVSMSCPCPLHAPAPIFSSQEFLVGGHCKYHRTLSQYKPHVEFFLGPFLTDVCQVRFSRWVSYK